MILQYSKSGQLRPHIFSKLSWNSVVRKKVAKSSHYPKYTQSIQKVDVEMALRQLVAILFIKGEQTPQKNGFTSPFDFMIAQVTGGARDIRKREADNFTKNDSQQPINRLLV
ncbi:hypothetical protein EG68_09874 [Paragonimus skrjabini miyazakii]|uniref:Uncharacterized protein n=1 Tax=Paragonimus skrjabini miyazakii TaxID=59628 RepID=A0A8S9YD86_9TREM|nr:hypothetical protein EG68_09874 [Paragonimus skrjabini miyazakii]